MDLAPKHVQANEPIIVERDTAAVEVDADVQVASTYLEAAALMESESNQLEVIWPSDDATLASLHFAPPSPLGH